MQHPRWALVGGVASVLLSLWFASSALITWWLRDHDAQWARAPIDVWSYVQAGVFALIAAGALLRRERVRPWLFGGGLATVMHSAIAMRLNPWCGVAVVLGALLVAASVLWKAPAPAA